jgi:hypothetical protein
MKEGINEMSENERRNEEMKIGRRKLRKENGREKMKKGKKK